MTRRSLFATLFAPLVAKFVSKRSPVSGVEIALNVERVRIIELWPRDNPVLYFMAPVKPYPWQDYDQDLKFLSGEQWDVGSCSFARPCAIINRIEPAALDYALSQVNSMLDRWNSD